MKRARVAALIVASAGLALGGMPSAAFAQAVPVYAETPADALARNIRILADSPKDFNALVGAGKAALQLGDAQSAAGFFGRAEEVWPSSPVPKAGMGAALAGSGEPSDALVYFSQAQRLGASVATFEAERGLAYDLLGNHAAAQMDYRAALNGPDRDEARRRLALSLAITGKKADALTTLAPLLARGDSAAVRCRALVLALGGDTEGAKQTLNARMPGSAAAMGPFFRRLPTLSSVQKAAAVNLGIFPESGSAMASAPASGAYGVPREDRLASIEQALRQQPQPAAPQPSVQYNYAAPAPAPAVHQQPQVTYASAATPQVQRAARSANDLVETRRVASRAGSKKIWLALAHGEDEGELTGEFQRIRSRKPSLFDGISGYVAGAGPRPRLVIGPFHTEEDARLFADALASVRIDSARWVSRPEEVVRRLSPQ